MGGFMGSSPDRSFFQIISRTRESTMSVALAAKLMPSVGAPISCRAEVIDLVVFLSSYRL
jgi:hypothetical protein